MSPEKAQYVQIVVKKEAPSKKVDYAKPKSWGVPTNQRLSYTGNFRK
ncbi:hypothetical protein HYS94_04650 [Candidatus Daviesbacteria bacterium]|nr:hypothetical protein [Candidatus Daviesbacteria bacterium]